VRRLRNLATLGEAVEIDDAYMGGRDRRSILEFLYFEFTTLLGAAYLSRMAWSSAA
jgi:hypothetical protein